MTTLVVGATGSIGRLVVAEAIHHGHSVRALVRSLSRARDLPSEARLIEGDLTKPETFRAAVEDVEAVVFTHATTRDEGGFEEVDYGGVRNVLAALGSRQVRIALMTAIGVTNRSGAYNRSTASGDWKRRSERLVRASGLPYTIVRPGWFDMNGPDQHELVLLQGDRRHAGDPSDGVIARAQIAEVLVHSLTSGSALRKTFELVSVPGLPPADLDELLSALEVDPPGALDGVLDLPNLPIEDEPARVREDLARVVAAH
jgi:uncharacterized protein YbjT (DUF2867 family)